ncbi:glycosyltransferase [Acinetobacter towneri]|uniref:glycosyltransferase n=1 Tax=Acinetobacter TaxID=469 RepID=UPI00103C5D67|nr:glycosyltransferase [Acinetobacter sp. ANC 5045]TCB18136.1 glycosyltransferase family 4 protein [Acinetobacter sp. ANC 5045]
MHVLILPSWYPLNNEDLNGCFFREQAHALSRAGMRVGVIAPQFRSLRQGVKAITGSYATEIWMDNNIPTYFKHGVFCFPKVPYLDLHRWVKAGLKLFERYIKEQGEPDVIHVHSLLLAGPLALEIYKKYNIPYCVTEHSTTFARELVSPWQWALLRESENFASHLSAVSNEFCLLLKQKLSGKEWEFLPNLLDRKFAEEIPILKKDNQFCAVGWMQSKKGFDILLKAFSILYKEKPEVKLILGGDGPERENLQKLAKILNIEEAVTFAGALPRESVRLLMAESACFVLSSHVETFGVVVIEALSQGTPVVATKCGGPESIIVSGDGILVEVADANALAQAMKEVGENPELYDSDSIRQRCLERFSEKAFISRVKEIYKHCIAESINA